MKISSYNVSANASHSCSGTVDNVYTHINKKEYENLSSGSSVEDLISISDEAIEKGYQFSGESQRMEIKETASLQQSNDSPQSSDFTTQKETDPTLWYLSSGFGYSPIMTKEKINTPANGFIFTERLVTPEPTKEEIEMYRQWAKRDSMSFASMPNNVLIKTEEVQITEETNVNMSADILSEDGKQINIDLNLDLQQDLSIKKAWTHTAQILDDAPEGWEHRRIPNADKYYSPDTKLDMEDDPENTFSPLMFQLEPGTPEFSGKSFSLDLDGDGQGENLSIPDKGAGLLAFDANGDGQIQDTEIINGFDQLSAHDDDGNGWIDENDEIFQKLTLWNPDMEGENSSGIDLLSADVGAIYLGSTKSAYTFRDGQGKELANLHSTGMFVRESSGTGGHVFQMGVKKSGAASEEQEMPDYVDMNLMRTVYPDLPASSPFLEPAESNDSEFVSQEPESSSTQESSSTKENTSPETSQAEPSKTKPQEKATTPEAAAAKTETAAPEETAQDNKKANSATEAKTKGAKTSEKSPDLTALNIVKNQETARNTENMKELKKQAEIIEQLQKNVTEKSAQLSDSLVLHKRSIKVDWYKSVKQMETIANMFKNIA